MQHVRDRLLTKFPLRSDYVSSGFRVHIGTKTRNVRFGKSEPLRDPIVERESQCTAGLRGVPVRSRHPAKRPEAGGVGRNLVKIRTTKERLRETEYGRDAREVLCGRHHLA